MRVVPADTGKAIKIHKSCNPQKVRNFAFRLMATIPRDPRFVPTREYGSSECNRKQPRNQVLAHSAVTILGLFFFCIFDPWILRKITNFQGVSFNQRECREISSSAASLLQVHHRSVRLTTTVNR